MSDASPNARALEQERRRRQLTAAALGGLVLSAVAVGGLAYGRRHARRDAVRGGPAHLALDREGPAIWAVQRGGPAPVWFIVLLHDAPVGERLSLECDWDSPEQPPDGQKSGDAPPPARHNAYETQSIDRPDWPTWCQQRFGADAAPGRWHVRMSLDGRELASASFEVN